MGTATVQLYTGEVCWVSHTYTHKWSAAGEVWETFLRFTGWHRLSPPSRSLGCFEQFVTKCNSWRSDTNSRSTGGAYYFLLKIYSRASEKKKVFSLFRIVWILGIIVIPEFPVFIFGNRITVVQVAHIFI